MTECWNELYKCKQMLIHYVLWQNLELLWVMNHNVIQEEEHLMYSNPDFQSLLTSAKDVLSFEYGILPLWDSCSVSKCLGSQLEFWKEYTQLHWEHCKPYWWFDLISQNAVEA